MGFFSRTGKQRAGNDVHQQLTLERLEARILLDGTLPDAYEPNDTSAEAAELGELTGTTDIPGLTLHDWGEQDWFSFATVGQGEARHSIQAELTSGAVYMGATLYDDQMTFIDQASGESIDLSLADLPAATYYVQVQALEGYGAEYTLTFQPPGSDLLPYISAHQPQGELSGPVEEIRLGFSAQMDQDSFTLADDIVSFEGPRGPITPTGHSWPDAQTLAIRCESQSAIGDYEMIVGPDILDSGGTALDTDADETPGEDPDDRYSAGFTISAPRITGHSPEGTLFESVSVLQFDFDGPMDQQSFDPAEDVVSFTGPNGALVPTGFTWVSGQSLEIAFPTQSAAGQYEMVLGPEILAPGGSRLNQDGDITPGEVPDDTYTAEFDIPAPRIIDHGPDGETYGPISSVWLRFDYAMDQASFSPDHDVVSFTGPSGAIQPTEYTWLIDSRRLEISFDPQVESGRYELVVGPGILDPLGNPLDQDEDLELGEVPDDTYTVDFAISAPHIRGHAPEGEVMGPVSSVEIQFDREMDQDSFSSSNDMVSFTGPTGPLQLTGYTWTDRRALEVSFPVQSTSGYYAMEVGPHILDPLGNPLDQDGDLEPGEVPQDSYVADFVISAPHVTGHVPNNTVRVPVSSITFEFDREMDQTSFSTDEDVVSFTGPAGPLQLTGHSWTDGRTLEISFVTQSRAGDYEMILGPHILDPLGNALDQDEDLHAGEVADDRYTATFSISGTTRVLEEDTIWSPDDGTIVVDIPITIPRDITLTIQPGTVVKFEENAALTVDGTLMAEGTMTDRIWLTSIRDDTVGGDTNGDHAESEPAASDWRCVSLGAAGHAYLTNTEIRYALAAVDVQPKIYNPEDRMARAELRTCVLTMGNFGIRVQQPYTEMLAENCLITENRLNAVSARADSRHTYRNCTLVGNGYEGWGHMGSDRAAVHVGGASLTLENSIVAFNGNGLHHSAAMDIPDLTVRNCDFYNPDGDEIVWGGDPGKPDLTQNGNLTDDPLFVDRNSGNYQLKEGSSAIDAGRGVQVPMRDMLGRPRYDDRGMPNMGHGYPCYVDMGAFERQEDSSAVDLAITRVSAPYPEAVSAGDLFNVEWTAMASGTLDAPGGWEDAVYLSDDPYPGDDFLMGTYTRHEPVSAGESYTGTLTTHVPDRQGPHYLLVRTNADDSLDEPTKLNNTMLAPTVLAVDVPLLQSAVPAQGTVGGTEDEWDYYLYYPAPADESVRFSVDSAAQSGDTELYVRHALPPAVGTSDARTRAGCGPNCELGVQGLQQGGYYVGVRRPEDATDYTLSVYRPRFQIIDISTREIGASGHSTLKITGERFRADSEAELVAGSTVIPADEEYVDPTTLLATFDCTAVASPPGLYNLVVTNPDSEQAVLPQPVTLRGVCETTFTSSLAGGGAARPGRSYELAINYANSGNVDIPSPLLILAADREGEYGEVVWRPLSDNEAPRSRREWISEPEVTLLAVSSEGRPSVLRPGQSESITIETRMPFVPGGFTYELYTIEAPPESHISGVGTAPENVGALATSIHSKPVSKGTDRADSGSGQQRGSQSTLAAQDSSNGWGDYVNDLRDNADYLAELGERVYDANELLAFEVMQSELVALRPYLETASDAYCKGAGPDLFFERYFLPSPSYRERAGTLGYGWSHSYDITLREGSHGGMIVNGPSGFDHWLTPDEQGGFTQDEAGGDSLSPEEDGGYMLARSDGTLFHFRPDGLFDYLEDTNGNRVTASYDDEERLEQLVHSGGDTFTLEYNEDGLLETLTDHVGRITTYAYDGEGEYLISVTRPDGESALYDYAAGGEPEQEHCLISSTWACGLETSYHYDEQGRLIEERIGEEGTAVQYEYGDTGRTLVTDSLGRTTVVWLGPEGHILRVEDPEGNVRDLSYDMAGNLVRVSGPTGAAFTAEYNEHAKIVKTIDPLGHISNFEHRGPYYNQTRGIDARGNPTNYEYDKAGNLKAVDHADGTRESFGYDDDGNLTRWTNRRGDTISYCYNERGQVTSKDFPDGTHYSYEYDVAGRLVQAVGPEGNTSLEYDANNDWLTRVTYPGGRWIAYQYNEAGRRTRMATHNGDIVNYHWSAGRLAGLTDGDGNQIVSYAYDGSGNLVREERANGAYTLYQYGPDARLSAVENYGPDDEVQSEYEYAHDASGRWTRVETHYGTWTYRYDAAGQLTQATLDSTDPNLEDQEFLYEYDAAGNRTRTVINGVVTEYAADNMDRYVGKGGASLEYDADGNLILQPGPFGDTVYEFDAASRLLSVTGPQGSWEYEYDALGHRVAVVRGGERTEYLIDPAGSANVMAAYDAQSEVGVSYTYGDGLCRGRDDAGNEVFYGFDAIGNTSEILDADGDILATSHYSPFGMQLGDSGGTGNPFQYVGKRGVSLDAPQHYFMRSRYYDAGIGRFLSEDRYGLLDSLSYTYASNNPVMLVDPNGEDFVCGFSAGSGMGIGVSAGVGCGASFGASFGISAGIGPGDPIPVSVGPDVGASYGCSAGVAAGFSSGWSAGFFCGYAVDVEELRRLMGLDKYDKIDELMKDLYRPHRHRPYFRPFDYLPDYWLPVPIYTSYTPEDKFGPVGYDSPANPAGSEERFIPGGQSLNYRVEFWNKEDAIVPTQDAIVEDTLDPEVFDLSTFKFTQVGFLQWDRTVSGQEIDTRIDCRPEMNIAVDVTAEVDTEAGEVNWWFHCVDPETGEYPDDPFAGFLPPFDSDTGYEIGWVEFTVEHEEGLPSGTEIPNQAFVEFDFAGDLYDHPAPKEGPWVNTLDAGLPTSRVEALPARVSAGPLPISWTGGDEPGGSGVAGYDIYVSDNGGEWESWLSNVAEGSGNFTGEAGHTYAFFSQAEDNVGHLEKLPSHADAQVHINVAPELTLDDPISGQEVFAGEIYTLGWTDSDSDDNAQISLYWDTDANPDNNDAVSRGTGWGTIAIGISEDDPVDSRDWQVRVPVWGQYYLYGVIDDGFASDMDYTDEPLNVIRTALVASETVDGTILSIYDADPRNGISQPDIAWKSSQFDRAKHEILVQPGRPGDGVINGILLLGDGRETAEIGIFLEGNTTLGRLVDVRRDPSALGFLGSEGQVGLVNLRAGIQGANLNGFVTEGGWNLPADLDDDGHFDDFTSLYGASGIQRAIVRGNLDGDVVAGDDVDLLYVIGGDLDGDVVTSGSDISRVIARARWDRASAQWTGGNIVGDITTAGNIGHVIALYGDIRGAIDVGGDVTLIKALGDIEGDIHVGGDLRVLLAIGGDITGMVSVDGDLRVMKTIGGDIQGAVEVGENLRHLVSVGGSFRADVTTGSLGRLVVGKNVEESAVSVSSSKRTAVRTGGDIQGSAFQVGDLSALYCGGKLCSTRVSGQNLGRVVVNGGMQDCSFDQIPGNLQSVVVRGDIERTGFEVGNRLSFVYSSGDISNTSIDAGVLGRVVARGRIWEDDSDQDLDEIHARGGSFSVLSRRGYAIARRRVWAMLEGGVKVYTG